MGVADNRTYKDEYLFQDDKYDVTAEQPSIHEEPKINTTIKENPYRSNVEIEGKEVVLKPDLSALFKASGKRHSKGGMDVLLQPDSFIFSDFKGLKFNDKDLELFELKEGGKNKIATPAEILKKNVDIEHYNSMVNILDDPYKDDLAKKSAAMMLEKYLLNLGNIAYIQEQKKGFPQGLPAFSQGTAPVYDPEVKDQIMENKQYMKAGGTINNPYYQVGGASGYGMTGPEDIYIDKDGRTIRATKTNRGEGAKNVGYTLQDIALASNNPYNRASASAVGSHVNYTDTGGSNRNNIIPPPQNTQTAALNNARNPTPWGLWEGDKMPIFQDRYGVSNAANKFDRLKNWDDVTQQLGYTGPKDNLAFQQWLYNSSPENRAIIDKWHNQYNLGPTEGKFDRKIGIRWANAINDILDKPKPQSSMPDCPCGMDRFGQCIPCEDKKDVAVVPGPKVPGLDITPQGSKQADWRFTPWQKLSQLWNWGQYANVQRYMPYRSRYNATYVDPALVNPEQAVGDIKAIGNQQLSSLTTLNPILRNAQAASIAGQVMNQLPGTRAQYDNQNANILNQTRQYNNQVKNNESLVNLGYDQQYYREAVEGRKNFENARQYAANQAMNNVLGDVQTNQKLAYNLLTQRNPAYGFDWNTGNFYRNPKSILDVQGNATNERYNDLLNMINGISDPTEKARLMLKLEGIKAFGSAEQNPSVFKKGGRKRSNPYRY